MGGSSFTPDADAFRFYEDGTESGSSPIAGESTNISRNVSSDDDIHLRYRVQETGGKDGAATDDYNLEYLKNGTGAWTTVTLTSTNVQIDSGSGLSHNTSTTNRATDGITDGSGTFVAGEQVDLGSFVTDRQLTANNFTEHVWGLLLVSADLSDGDTLDFRMVLNGGSPGMANSVTPRVTVSNGNSASLEATVTGSASLSVRRLLSHIGLDAATTGSASLEATQPLSRQTLAATVTASASMLFKTTVRLSAVVTGSAALLVKRFVALSAAVTGTATLEALALGSRLLEATVTGSATVTAKKIVQKILSATTTGTATISTDQGEPAYYNGSDYYNDNISVYESTAGPTAQALEATATGSAMLGATRPFSQRVLSATATGAASITRKLFVAFNAAVTGVATSVRLVGVTTVGLEATATGSASITVRALFKRLLDAATTGVATLLHNKGKTAYYNASSYYDDGISVYNGTTALNLVTFSASVTGAATLLHNKGATAYYNLASYYGDGISVYNGPLFVEQILSAQSVASVTFSRSLSFVITVTLSAIAVASAALSTSRDAIVSPFTGHAGGLDFSRPSQWMKRQGWRRRK